MTSSSKVQEFEDLIRSLNTIIFGDGDVSLGGVVKPTVSKFLKSIADRGWYEEPFLTESALLATVPNKGKTIAKAMDTRAIWYWGGTSWVKIGLGEYDTIMDSVLEDLSRNSSDYTDLNVLVSVESGNGHTVAVIKPDGNYISADANLHEMSNDINKIKVHSVELENINGRTDIVEPQGDIVRFERYDGTPILTVCEDKTIKLDDFKISKYSFIGSEKREPMFMKEHPIKEYLDANLPRMIYGNVSNLSPFAGSFKQNFMIKNTSDFLGLKISQGTMIDIDTPYYRKKEGPFGSQVVHPYLCKFKKTVRGFSYILLITPFHSTIDMYENPCVYGTNDLVNFTLLDMFEQPLAYLRRTGYYNYNSDPSCMFDHDSGEFVVFFRNTEVISGANVSKFLTTRTKDFVTWSKPVEFELPVDVVSPTGTYDCNRRKWVIYSSTQILVADRLEGPWSIEQDYVYGNRGVWHQEVRYCGGHYIGIFNNHAVSSENSLYLGISKDGINWQYSGLIMEGPHSPCYKASISHEFVDDNHIRFVVCWTSSDLDPSLANKWKMYVHKTNPIEVI